MTYIKFMIFAAFKIKFVVCSKVLAVESVKKLLLL